MIEFKRTYSEGVILLSIIYIMAKFLFFAAPWAVEMGKLGRGLCREVVILLNLSIGYHWMPSESLKYKFLRWGVLLELCFFFFVGLYSWLNSPPALIGQLQVMFRELLLSPAYFALFWLTCVQRQVIR